MARFGTGDSKKTTKAPEVATKEDLRRLSRDLDNNLRKRTETPGHSSAEIAGKAIKMASRGFADIGRSLNSPYDARRPKIAQLPARRKDMSISTSPDLEYLKHPSLRGGDIKKRGGGKRK